MNKLIREQKTFFPHSSLQYSKSAALGEIKNNVDVFSFEGMNMEGILRACARVHSRNNCLYDGSLSAGKISMPMIRRF